MIQYLNRNKWKLYLNRNRREVWAKRSVSREPKALSKSQNVATSYSLFPPSRTRNKTQSSRNSLAAIPTEDYRAWFSQLKKNYFFYCLCECVQEGRGDQPVMFSFSKPTSKLAIFKELLLNLSETKLFLLIGDDSGEFIPQNRKQDI